MEKYQEKPQHRAARNASQGGKPGSGEFTARPKSTLDKYQGKFSATYRERSVSNARGVGPKQLAGAKPNRMSQHSMSTLNNTQHRTAEQL